MIRQVGDKDWECTIDDAAELIDHLLDKNQPVMLWGDTGVGKSSIVYQRGQRTNKTVIDFRTNIREPVDMRGIPVPDLAAGMTRWLPPAELPRVDRDGEEGIFFADEINTNVQMMPVMMQLVLERRVGEYNFPPSWSIIAAGNRVSDRAAAQRMPSALANRFAHITIIPDVDAWCKWAVVAGVAPEVVAFIRFRRELLHKRPEGEARAFPTPRSWEQAAQHVKAPKRLRVYLFAAHVGFAAASELDAFIDLYETIGTLDDIVKDPDNAPVPDRADVRYATCAGLAKIATRKNFDNIIRYAKRLPREFQVLVVVDATTREKKLKEVSAYGRWAVENADVLLQN